MALVEIVCEWKESVRLWRRRNRRRRKDITTKEHCPVNRGGGTEGGFWGFSRGFFEFFVKSKNADRVFFESLYRRPEETKAQSTDSKNVHFLHDESGQILVQFYCIDSTCRSSKTPSSTRPTPRSNMYFSSALARRYHVLRPSSSSWIRAASTTTPTAAAAAAAAPTTTASLLPTTTPTAPPLDTATVQEVLSSTMQSTANTLHHPPNVVFDTVQQGLETLHAFTGLPWWCTLIGSTLLVRSSFLPLTLHQLRATARYATSAKPENDRLWSLVNKVTGTGADTATTLKAYQIYYQGMTSVLKKHRISLLSMFGGTLIQIPVFVTFVFTVRRMIRDPELAHELAMGGAL